MDKIEHNKEIIKTFEKMINTAAAASLSVYDKVISIIPAL